MQIAQTLDAYDPIVHLRTNPADRWMFRWRLEYASGNSKYGIWNGATRFEDTAAAQKKEGLIAAIVEGKHFLRREIRIFAECPGQDIVNFEHMAVYIKNQQSPISFVYGLRIRSRNRIISCFADGSINRHDWRPDKDYIWPEWTRT